MEGNERHESLTYPDEEFLYYVCARDFGWTPTQVDEQPAPTIDWILAIAGIEREVHDKDKPPTR